MNIDPVLNSSLLKYLNGKGLFINLFDFAKILKFLEITLFFWKI